MGSGQNTQTNTDGANSACVAPVDAGLTGQNLAPHNSRLQVKQNIFNFHRVRHRCFFGRSMLFKFALYFGIHFTQTRRTHLLFANLIGLFQPLFCDGFNRCNQRFVAGWRLPVPFRLAGFAYQFVNGINGRLHLLMPEHHAIEHGLFRQLFRLGLNHEHSRFGACHNQVHAGNLQLRRCRVQNVFIIDIAHTRRADRTVKWNTGNGQRSRRTDHGRDIRVDFGINRQDMNNDLYFVIKPFGKQRAQRTIDQAAR